MKPEVYIDKNGVPTEEDFAPQKVDVVNQKEELFKKIKKRSRAYSIMYGVVTILILINAIIQFISIIYNLCSQFIISFVKLNREIKCYLSHIIIAIVTIIVFSFLRINKYQLKILMYKDPKMASINRIFTNAKIVILNENYQTLVFI